MLLNHDERKRYAKQISLPEIGESGQIKLKSASVLCIGAGGLGAALLPYLAAAGVGRIGIIDHDKVELSNLQRQVIYTLSDIGMKKVDAAIKTLHQLNPEVEIETFDAAFNQENALALMRHYDIAADCTDNLSSRRIINAICHQLDKPFVFAGISQFQGQCMLFHGKRGPCFSCVFPEMSPYDSLPDCNSAGVLGVLPGMLGLLQANIVLQYILGLSQRNTGRLYMLDMLNINLRDYHIARDVHCHVCGNVPSFIPMDQEILSISADDLRHKLNYHERFTLLDVRTLEERELSNLGGVHIPLAELPTRMSQLDAELPVIVYCQSGKRSIAAAKMLAKNNFKMIAYLAGGIVSCQPCGMISLSSRA